MLFTYRFYSRKQGWYNSDKTAKFFHTNTISIDDVNIKNLEGKTGKEIIDSNLTTDASLLEKAKIYNDWYLYRSGIKIGCSTEHYI